MNRLFLAPTILAFALSGCALGNSTKTSPPSANSISVVQAAGITGGGFTVGSSTDTITITLPNPVQNGDLVGVVLWWNQKAPTENSVTVADSQFNSYLNVAPNNVFSWAWANTVAYAFYAKNVAGASNFTVTASTNPGNGGQYYMAVVEAKNASAFDQWVAGSNCTNAQGCTMFTTNQFQVTHADTLLIGLGSLGSCQGCTGSGSSLGAGSNFTLVNDNVTGNRGSGVEYLVITTPGQASGVFTASIPWSDAQAFFAFY